MLKKYYPYAYAKSVFDIDYRKVYNMGYRGIIFDVDNTLVHHGDDSNERVDSLFRELKKIGMKTVLLSDNSDERMRRFIENIDSPYVSEANKPNPEGFYKALEMINVEKDKALVIGDQIFKDVLGANKSGLRSILVHFIQIDPSAPIGLRRYVEKVILAFYRHSKRFNVMGDIFVEE